MKPMWFLIRKGPSIINGSDHFLSLITKSRFLPMEQQEIVLNVIERNAFFAHRENMMISLLAIDDVTLKIV